MIMIKGIEKLSKEQKELMYRVNKIHTQCVGSDYKDGMKIKEVWLDENDCVCVRLMGGDWFHYTIKGEWY